MENFCSICQDTIDIKKTITTPCSHIFCKRCMDMWRNKNNNTCPVCRQVFMPVRKAAHKRLMDLIKDCQKKRRLDHLQSCVDYWTFYGCPRNGRVRELFTNRELNRLSTDEAIDAMYGSEWLKYVVFPYIKYKQTHVGFFARLLC
jgi:hypothetical protein